MFPAGLMEAAAAEVEQMNIGLGEDPGPVGPAFPLGGELGVAAPLRPSAKALSAPKASRAMTIQEAFAKFRLPEKLQTCYLEAIGSEDGGEEAEVAAHVPPDTIFDALGTMVTNLGKTLTPLEKGHVAKFVKALRREFVEAPPPSTGASSSTDPAPGQRIVVEMPDTSDRLPLKDLIDQTLMGTCEELTMEEIAQLRRNYVRSTGASPTNAERPTDEQLSALSFRLRPQKNGRVNPPWVEFAIWGPFSSRSARMRQFTAHVLTRDGTWSQKQLRGPTSYEQWETCWDVFACAMVMLNVASVGVLRQYAAGIRQLSARFKDDWATIFTLDEEMRAEQWDRLRQEIEDGEVAPPLGYLSENPWMSIISATRFGYLAGPRADWWREREVLLERGSRSRPNKGTGGLNALAPPPFPGWGTGGIDTEQMTIHKGGASAQLALADAPGKHANKNKKRRDGKKTQKAEVTKGGGKGGKGKIGPCHICGEYGHLKANCPKKKQSPQGAAQAQPNPSKKKGKRSQK